MKERSGFYALLAFISALSNYVKETQPVFRQNETQT